MRRAKGNRLESRMLAALEALVSIENQRGEFGWKLDVVFETVLDFRGSEVGRAKCEPDILKLVLEIVVIVNPQSAVDQPIVQGFRLKPRQPPSTFLPHVLVHR